MPIYFKKDDLPHAQPAEVWLYRELMSIQDEGKRMEKMIEWLTKSIGHNILRGDEFSVYIPGSIFIKTD